MRPVPGRPRSQITCCGCSPPAHVRLIKGSHIVVPRLFEHDHAYIFQNADNRIVFAIPYERDFTLIGTTDRGLQGRSRGADRERGRDRLSVRRRERVFPQSRDAGSGGASLFGRAPALRRRRAQRAEPHPRIRARPATGAPARRRCSPSMAARSPPTGGSPRRRSSASRRISSSARRGPRLRRCRAATFPHDGVEALVARARGLWPFLTEAERAAPGARLWHAARPHPRRCARPGRARRALRRRTDRRRGALPDAP